MIWQIRLQNSWPTWKVAWTKWCMSLCGCYYHIVRRGNIVVYPRYQSGLLTPAERMTGNAIEAVKDAIKQLESGDHVTPDLDKYAIVSHSLGGSISVNMAAYADSVGLPKPKAIMLAEPGQGGNIGANILANDLSTISSDTLMLIVVGADDTEVGSTTGRKIMEKTSHISNKNKQLMTMHSDYHGNPPLIADHYAPVAPDERYDFNDDGVITEWLRELAQYVTGGEVDSLDYYGFWRLFDELIDTAFNGKNHDNALGKTTESRFMGEWSDSTPITELSVN